MGTRGRLVIANREWERLRDEFAKKQKVEKMPQLLSVQKPATKKYNEYYVELPRPKSRTSFKNIQDFIHNAKKVVAKEKFLPINLKRAMLLSDIFTEKKNQLRFQKVLKKIDQELEDREKRLFDEQMENYRKELMKEKEVQLNKKNMLGKRLKNEMMELNAKKRREKLKENEEEREEILKINRQLEENEKNIKVKTTEAKRAIDKMHREDVLEKLHQMEASKKLDEDEYRIAEAQRELLSQLNDQRNALEKSIHVKKPPRTKIHESEGQKEVIKRCYDLPFVKKSKLEEKRELYFEHLKHDRIKGYQVQVDEMLKRKSTDRGDKLNEYERRCENITVTNSFERLKRRHMLEKNKEYRNIWNHQLASDWMALIFVLAEKSQSEEKTRQEDVSRREKLLEKLRLEDEQYLNTVTLILEDYKKQDKVIEPIIKCLKSGYCN